MQGYSIVNHMLLPKAFGCSTEEDYWQLREHVQLWDVSCQRQVEIQGLDAARLLQWMTPRDLRNAKIDQCLYVPLIDQNAGMLNDPILLKLTEDRFWLSIADSDVLLWTKGLALGYGMDVQVGEPDVSPLAVQGPKADALLEKVFGSSIRSIRFFRFGGVDFNGHPLGVARSGYSKQGGFKSTSIKARWVSNCGMRFGMPDRSSTSLRAAPTSSSALREACFLTATK